MLTYKRYLHDLASRGLSVSAGPVTYTNSIHEACKDQPTDALVITLINVVGYLLRDLDQDYRLWLAGGCYSNTGWHKVTVTYGKGD